MPRMTTAPDLQRLHLFSPAGVLTQRAALTRARKRLATLGFAVTVDEAATARHQRFAGDDDTRLQALHRVAAEAPDVALATRGGYGLARLLDRLDWPLLARSVARGTRWVGHSDVEHFGKTDDEGGVDEVTRDCFAEAMRGELEAVGFRTEAGFDGLAVRGKLWGGNLTVLSALLGTPHWPKVKGGVLFLEDVNEHPYRVERLLLQLHQAGVLGAQKAVLLGSFNGWRQSPLDRGYTLKTAIAHVRSVCPVPILTGLPFGHQATLVTMPVGRRVELVVQGRDTLVVWGD